MLVVLWSSHHHPFGCEQCQRCLTANARKKGDAVLYRPTRPTAIASQPAQVGQLCGPPCKICFPNGEPCKWKQQKVRRARNRWHPSLGLPCDSHSLIPIVVITCRPTGGKLLGKRGLPRLFFFLSASHSIESSFEFD